jgi:hypothetical protein
MRLSEQPNKVCNKVLTHQGLAGTPIFALDLQAVFRTKKIQNHMKNDKIKDNK